MLSGQLQQAMIMPKKIPGEPGLDFSGYNVNILRQTRLQ